MNDNAKLTKLVLIFVATLIMVACGTNNNNEENADENNAENKSALNNEADWDDSKDEDKIIGKSDKDYSELTDQNPSDVRNDNTGDWRISTLSEGVAMEEYALSYHDLHMEEGEVHHVVNFAYNTTTWLNELGGLLYVDVKEYVDKEEHDASTLGSGMLLKSYKIYPDGDIQELDE